jgi:GWxTD domain-containing protein
MPALLVCCALLAAAAGETRYAKWLDEDVAYIVSAKERADFARLNNDAERDRFIADFWKRRDPTPDTPLNEFKVEHYRRIACANQRFASSAPGWKTDRGWVYIVYGPPDEIESHPSTETEKWHLHYLEGVGTNVELDFAGAGLRLPEAQRKLVLPKD